MLKRLLKAAAKQGAEEVGIASGRELAEALAEMEAREQRKSLLEKSAEQLIDAELNYLRESIEDDTGIKPLPLPERTTDPSGQQR